VKTRLILALLLTASSASVGINGQTGLGKDASGTTQLPNGWKITPAGKTVASLGDVVVDLLLSPDGKVIVANHSGYLPHGLEVLDAGTQRQIQHIELKTTWLGMTWSPDGRSLYVAGGNASGDANKADPRTQIYEFTYANRRLSEKPEATFVETVDPKLVWWSGVAASLDGRWLYAANRGTGTGPGNVVVFDVKTRNVATRIPVDVSPYQIVLSPDGQRLFVSNWSSQSVSVIDTRSNRVVRTLPVGANPNDMKLSSDGRLFVACSNDNTVYVIDTRTLEIVERLAATLTPLAPEGATPNALAIDNTRKRLYIANADNNSIAVADIGNRSRSAIAGFIPTGWYPSALALADHGRTLYIGNTKGDSGHPDPKGGSYELLTWKPDQTANIYTLQTASLEAVPVAELKTMLPHWTHQVIENTPYNDSLLSHARPSRQPSIIPERVGVGSPIKHIIFIIKENRTFDQEFGDLPHANGDPSLTIFGEKITPNQHALAKQYVTLDNLYCDGEVSMDGHSWSNSAYATDFNEKNWPSFYAERSSADTNVRAMVPSAGHLWDLAKRKGLTYRSYGEFADRASKGAPMEAIPGAEGLVGHVSRDYMGGLDIRDTERVAVFLREFREYEANYDSDDPEKRLPNFIVMSLPEDHTVGTVPGAYSPSAMVANNDFATGQLIDAVSHSRYWPETAIFIIEDDAQDGPDHVDARRTVGLVVSPYVKRGMVDDTLYSTSSMLRSIELLLGLPPMSQYDAAATPMYSSFGLDPIMTPFNVIQPLVDVDTKTPQHAYGAQESSKMDFSDLDRAPMRNLNEIIWRSVRGNDSRMPPPVHRYRPLMDATPSSFVHFDAEKRSQ